MNLPLIAALCLSVVGWTMALVFWREWSKSLKTSREALSGWRLCEFHFRQLLAVKHANDRSNQAIIHHLKRQLENQVDDSDWWKNH